MNGTIKRKIQLLLWGSLAGILILAIFILIATFTQRSVDGRVSSIDSTVLTAKSISNAMSNAQADYGAYKNAPSDAGVTRVNKDIADLEKQIAVLDAKKVSANELKTLKRDVSTYKSSFKNYVTINKMTGYNDTSGSRGTVTKMQGELLTLMAKTNNIPVLVEYNTFQHVANKTVLDPSSKNWTNFSKEANSFDYLVSKNLNTSLQSDYNQIMLDYKSAVEDLNGHYNLTMMLMKKFDQSAGQVQKTSTDIVNTLNQQRTGLMHLQSLVQNIILILMILLSLATIIALVLFGNRLIQSVMTAIDVLKKGAEHLGKGQLKYRVPLIGNDELTELAGAFNQMAANMELTIEQVLYATDTLSSSSQNLAAISQETSAQSIEVNEAIQQVAAGAQTQAEHLEDGMELIQSVTMAINDTASLSDEIDSQSQNAQLVSQKGISVITELETTTNQFLQITKLLVGDIQEVAKQSEEINSILKIIQDISKNTDLLALNAAIESARAGEAGRGFAVVSQEIRKLAERSKKETQTIQSVIIAITKRLRALSEETTKLNQFSNEQEQGVKETRHAFNGIADNVTAITTKVGSIQDAVTKVTNTTQDLTRKLEEISAISEETAASTQQVSASSVAQTEAIEQVNEAAIGLQDIAVALEKEVVKFDLETTTFEEERPLEAREDIDIPSAYEEAAATLSTEEETETDQEDNSEKHS